MARQDLIDQAPEAESNKAPAPLRAPNPVTSSRHPGDILLRLLSFLSAALVLGLIALLIIMLVINAWPSITSSGMDFFSQKEFYILGFSPVAAIVGTLYAALLALIMAAPVAVLIAIFLSEIAPRGIRRPLGFVVELLAAIPSIVYGLWALIVVAPLMIHYVNPFLNQHFGGFPLFNETNAAGEEYFTAGIVLAVMILPTIAAISRDVIASVPSGQREAMLALGATRWETIWKVVVPAARGGIIGAILLGLGRAVGETMAVVMVVGNSQTYGASMLRYGTTMAATIVNDFSEMSGSALNALYELALLLLVLSIFLNAVARLLVWTVNRRYAA